jgi:hypothetical protein
LIDSNIDDNKMLEFLHTFEREGLIMKYRCEEYFDLIGKYSLFDLFMSKDKFMDLFYKKEYSLLTSEEE